MFKTLEAKIKTIWLVLRSSNIHMIFQRYPGANPGAIGFGKAELRDLVLMSKEIKLTHENFVEMIAEIAVHNGELHNLKALEEAVEVIEDTDGGK
jgi:hypothetical protein